jgi:hypothetical protein
MADKAALEFRKGGVVIFNEWVYDHEAGVGEYVERDLTAEGKWLHKRDQTVSFAEDVTLNDVFLFLARDPEICDIVFCNCFIESFMKTWSKIDQAAIKYTQEYDVDGIEYLELYWGADLFTYEGVTTISGLSRADFHGKGFVLKEDKGEDDSDFIMYKKGTRIQWGLDFTSLDSILGLPIKLNTKFEIQEEWARGKKIEELKMFVSCDREYTLHEAIEGIMWELSFYGSDENRMEKKEEILGIKAEIDAGTAELIEVICDKTD